MSNDPTFAEDAVGPALDEARGLLAGTLEALLPHPSGPEARLFEAMRQATKDGPCWRAFLVLQSGRLFGVDLRPLGRVAAAVECVHGYGRTHAGLPAGSAEPAAILAGDALLVYAFALLGAAETSGDPYVRSELTTRLAQAAGHAGLIGGQMLEILFAGGTEGMAVPLPEISRLQRMKTAAVMMFCCEAGAIVGHGSPPARHALSAYGQDFGLALQIACDLGAVPSGASNPSRPTIVSALGAERAQAQALALTAQAVRHLDLFDEKADLLRAAAEYVGRRAGRSGCVRE